MRIHPSCWIYATKILQGYTWENAQFIDNSHLLTFQSINVEVGYQFPLKHVVVHFIYVLCWVYVLYSFLCFVKVLCLEQNPVFPNGLFCTPLGIFPPFTWPAPDNQIVCSNSSLSHSCQSPVPLLLGPVRHHEASPCVWKIPKRASSDWSGS